MHGKVIYQQDENGRYKLDKSGKKKPVRIPKLGRATDEDDKKLEDVGYLSRPTFVRNRFSRTMLINIAYIAYMTIHEKNKNGWFCKAAEDFFWTRNVPGGCHPKISRTGDDKKTG